MELTGSAWLLAVVAAFLVGFSKAGMPGMGILTVPLMALVFQAKPSVAMLLPVLIVGDISSVSIYRRHADWPKVWQLLPWVAVGTIPGALALKYVGAKEFEPLMGWLVLAMVALELVRRRLEWDRVPHHWAFAGFTGIAAGFATTVGNVAGPIMTIYFLSRGLEKNALLGTASWFFLLVNVTKVPIFAGLDMFTTATWVFTLWMIPAVVVGATAGYFAQAKIPQRAFNAAVLVLAVAAALLLIAG